MQLVANFANTKWYKKLKNDGNPCTWVLIWESLVRTIQWTTIWQGLYYFQKSLHPCTLDESSLSVGRVNSVFQKRKQRIFPQSLTVSPVSVVLNFSAWMNAVNNISFQYYPWLVTLTYIPCNSRSTTKIITLWADQGSLATRHYYVLPYHITKIITLWADQGSLATRHYYVLPYYITKIITLWADQGSLATRHYYVLPYYIQCLHLHKGLWHTVGHLVHSIATQGGCTGSNFQLPF